MIFKLMVPLQYNCNNFLNITQYKSKLGFYANDELKWWYDNEEILMFQCKVICNSSNFTQLKYFSRRFVFNFQKWSAPIKSNLPNL
jgi:hypothetical protein